jgi:dUTP pyrophosphatase
MLDVKVFNNSPNELPKYETPGAAGLDLKSAVDYILKPGEYKMIPTNMHIKLPDGHEAQVRPRSGLAVKYGISVVNAPGTVDADYTGQIGVILINHGTNPFEIKIGDRIAQMVVNKVEQLNWVPVDSIEALGETERGQGGFGSTGK